jgi:hypothetical protein
MIPVIMTVSGSVSFFRYITFTGMFVVLEAG